MKGRCKLGAILGWRNAVYCSTSTVQKRQTTLWCEISTASVKLKYSFKEVISNQLDDCNSHTKLSLSEVCGHTYFQNCWSCQVQKKQKKTTTNSKVHRSQNYFSKKWRHLLQQGFPASWCFWLCSMLQSAHWQNNCFVLLNYCCPPINMNAEKGGKLKKYNNGRYSSLSDCLLQPAHVQ